MAENPQQLGNLLQDCGYAMADDHSAICGRSSNQGRDEVPQELISAEPGMAEINIEVVIGNGPHAERVWGAT